DDPADWNLVKGALANVATDTRSTMKTKVDTSITKKQDIYQLTNALLMYDMRPTVAHWGRFALLREVAQKHKNKKTYWQAVDNRLKEIRNKVKREYPQTQWRQKVSE
ncbi:hypothetical protein C8Q72DRAFT_790408, partial [Fomitopsis betulina]